MIALSFYLVFLISTVQQDTSWSDIDEWLQVRSEKKGKVYIIQNDKEYSRIFHETYAKYVRPTPKRTIVSFKSRTVVAIAWGAKPSTGYLMEVKSVKVGKDITTITVFTRRPSTGAIVGMMFTYPSVAIMIPKSDSLEIRVEGDGNYLDFENMKGKGYRFLVN